ncbi:MAG: FHA domain-containing protein [Ilumatobacter sp.]|nr:FHA domain-containing protein [Ilumatobacter sp.]
MVVDTTDDARVGDLVDELDHQGFDTYGLKSDGVVLAAGESLVTSPIRHGAVLGRNVPDPAPGPGWYLVSVAGPDTGTYHRIAGTPISVGRAAGNDLVVADSSLSGRHFTASVTDDGVEISDLGSTNGTTVEGDDVDGTVTVADEAYVHAGATTFGIVRIDPGAIPSEPAKNGPSVAFQRRFRDAERRLPDAFKHPTEPRESKESSRRPLISFAIPIVTAVGMAMITGRWIFLLVIGLGPIFYAIDGVRRRKLQAREFDAEVVDYQRRRDRLIADLGEARREELRRDRWTAAPAGLAALLAASRHERLWERSVNDDDFCEVAIGLHDRPSSITVDGRPDDATFPMDTQWSAVLRHSLVREGPLAVRGGLDRARALGRSILLDLATSHSPNDVKLWLLTDESLADDWNAVRWMPHTFLGDGQNRIFATPAARAAALSLLRSTIDERRREADGRSASALPVHVVVIDCVEALDPAELTDLLVDGAAVGVVGITIDSKVTPEGSNAELSLGRYSDEATFVSQTRPRVDRIRSVEMSTAVFERPTRAMSGCRPAGSARDDVAGSEVIRLVDLIDAETDPARADEVARRWSMSSGTSRIRVGGLGDLVTELDIVRDGPHGLVGGTTRSGKTEFLKSLITSLAVANHPDDLSIAIVDFKGGVDHELSARLPHVIDLSTNHDVDSFVRTVRLIEAEMQRRQRSFKQVGAPNFDAYRAARRSDPSLAPVPRLLVIVDEFSELLSSETGKENLSSLESVTRVGGGLGVHLLLVTQNFENQLPNQIAANAGMRICFRVQEAAHSKAVLNSPEAATIPKERIGRAFLRSHGGRAIEFQAARVAGPRPGKEVVAAAVQVRQVPFASLADAPPTEAIVDVPAEDTDMWAVVETLRAAAAASGWTAPAVPWPKELPAQVGIADVNRSPTATWPIGLVDEPELQRQSIVEFEPFGPHVLLLGGDSSALADVVRALTVSGAARRGPDRLQFYVLDQLGQGLGGLLALPHVGGVAERNEPLALRMLRHVATEVSRRKAKLSDLGVSNVSEYHTATGETLTEVVLVVHGADRILSLGESNQSLLLGPLIGLVSEAAGTGVRVVMTGPANIAHHRIGSSIGRRFVFELPDRQEYTAVGVPRLLHGSIRGTGRAVDVNRERLVQFALVPSSPDAPASEVVRAIGHRLTSEYVGPTDALPVRLSELPWPLPIRDVAASTPPEGVRHPVVLAVDTELGEVAWLDAEEDGPTFVVTGPTRSGRSTTLLAAAHLMRRHGWGVVALPVSRRSPLTPGTFPGSVTTPEDVKTLAESPGPVALFIDDAHRWTAPVDGLQAFLDGPGPRAVIMAGPTEFFGSRGDLTRALPARTALLLTPKSAMDGSNFGVRRIADEVLRDTRAGRGVLAVAGEVIGAQVPFVE